MARIAVLGYRSEQTDENLWAPEKLAFAVSLVRPLWDAHGCEFELAPEEVVAAAVAAGHVAPIYVKSGGDGDGGVYCVWCAECEPEVLRDEYCHLMEVPTLLAVLPPGESTCVAARLFPESRDLWLPRAPLVFMSEAEAVILRQLVLHAARFRELEDALAQKAGVTPLLVHKAFETIDLVKALRAGADDLFKSALNNAGWLWDLVRTCGVLRARYNVPVGTLVLIDGATVVPEVYYVFKRRRDMFFIIGKVDGQFSVVMAELGRVIALEAGEDAGAARARDLILVELALAAATPPVLAIANQRIAALEAAEAAEAAKTAQSPGVA
jgi:hypothetical protein